MALTATLFNVESTLNWRLRAALEYKAGATDAEGADKPEKHPVLAVPVYVVTHMPREQLTALPAYSLHHHDVSTALISQGARVGRKDTGETIYGKRYSGLVDISIWAKRPARDSNGGQQEVWLRQLRVLASDLQLFYVTNTIISVRNFADNKTVGGVLPSDAHDQTFITLRDLRAGAGAAGAEADPKAPDLMRRRMVVAYTTELRGE